MHQQPDFLNPEALKSEFSSFFFFTNLFFSGDKFDDDKHISVNICPSEVKSLSAIYILVFVFFLFSFSVFFFLNESVQLSFISPTSTFVVDEK